METITCTNCGAQNSAYLKYCSSCGHALPAPPAPIVESIPPQPDTFTTRVNKHKGLVGAVFGIIFFALTVYAVQHFYSKVASINNFQASAFESVMNMTAMQLNQKCPMMVDEATRLDNVEVLPGTVFQYNYTLVSLDGADVSPDTLQKYIEPQIIENVRTNPEMLIYRQNKTTFVYQYRDKNSIPILKILITPDMYQ